MRIGTRAFVVVAAAALVACGHAAPPPPPPPPPQPPSPPPPPAPPKCESLEEGCTATDSTHARIQDSGWSVQLPSGWKYAQEASTTFAATKSAAFVVTSEPDDNGAAYRNALSRAALRLEVHAKKGALELPKKPEKIVAIGSLKISLHQIDHARRDGKRGALLVFWTKLPTGAALVGVGFVADDDDTKADTAILNAVVSIAPAGPPADKDKDVDGGAS